MDAQGPHLRLFRPDRGHRARINESADTAAKQSFIVGFLIGVVLGGALAAFLVDSFTKHWTPEAVPRADPRR